MISIHALRVEGDLHELEDLFFGLWISIHALRVEGDECFAYRLVLLLKFLSTPSGWRATAIDQRHRIIKCFISIHALRVEGDALRVKRNIVKVRFLSTPSGWRATIAVCLLTA